MRFLRRSVTATWSEAILWGGQAYGLAAGAPQFFASANTDGNRVLNESQWNRGIRAASQVTIEPSFVSEDADDNGQLTLHEVTATLPDSSGDEFPRSDTNYDGALSSDELRAAGVATKAPLQGTVGSFNRADADNDGTVTLAEVTAVSPQFRREQFADLGGNNDGVPSVDEWASGVRGAAP